MVDKGRILGVDPGEKSIGLAISDPTAMLARPLQMVKHISLIIDSSQIAQIASENDVILIVIGYPTGGNGEVIPQSRHSQKLANAIHDQCNLPVELWDENDSTLLARKNLIDLNVSVSKRGGHQDSLAATVILQSYLDAHYIME
jgi:putative holliday junction resolvase